MPKDDVLHVLGSIQGTLNGHTEVLRDMKRQLETINGTVDNHSREITKHSVEVESLKTSRRSIRTLSSGAAIVAIGALLRSYLLNK